MSLPHLIDDVLGAQGLHESFLDATTEFLGGLVAEGFLDLAVAFEFQHQATGQRIGQTGAVQHRLHGLAQRLAQGKTEDAWSARLFRGPTW